MCIIGPVRTAHFGRCRSFPNRFGIRRKAAADLGGGYFFRSTPNLIAAITSISNAMVSAVLMRSPPLRGNNRTVLTGEPHHTRSALLCQFSAPPTGRLFVLSRLSVLPKPRRKPCGTCQRIDPPAFLNAEAERDAISFVGAANAGVSAEDKTKVILVAGSRRTLPPVRKGAILLLAC